MADRTRILPQVERRHGWRCDDQHVDGYVGQASLDWPPNDMITFGPLDVKVDVSQVGGVWVGWAELVDHSPDTVEFIRLFPNPYRLLLPNEDPIWVNLGDLSNLDRFQLTEFHPDDQATS